MMEQGKDFEGQIDLKNYRYWTGGIPLRTKEAILEALKIGCRVSRRSKTNNYFRVLEQNKETGKIENVYVFETYNGVRNFAMNQQSNNKDYTFETAKEMQEKELTVEVIEYIVGIRHIVKRHEDTMNKDMAYVYRTVLYCLYDLLKLEGYSEKHLNEVIYSERFEHKGIKY